MKLFKSIDEKFKEIGFEKIEENKHGAIYHRQSKCGYNHVVDIMYKVNGYPIVQSYDKDLMDAGKHGNIGVGLTAYEMKLCLKKMKEMGWKIKK